MVRGRGRERKVDGIREKTVMLLLVMCCAMRPLGDREGYAG